MSPDRLPLDHFLIVGLGGLGQHCVVSLKAFGVKVIAINLNLPQDLEIANLLDLLDDLIIGDSCQDLVLEQAKINQCRAALLVTKNERINAETAIAVRRLNPETRLVVRSSQINLNHLLSEQLGNFIAFEPTQLPAAAFAIAALGTETLGFFQLDGQWFRTIQRSLNPQQIETQSRPLFEFNNRTRRILSHQPVGTSPPSQFHTWEGEARLQAGDTLTYIEAVEKISFTPTSSQPSQLTLANFSQKIQQFVHLNLQEQIRKIAALCGAIILILLAIGTLLFHHYSPDLSWAESFYTTVILLLGGYGDIFGNWEDLPVIPWGLKLFALGLTLAGTAFIGVLYALLTEAILSSKFQLTRQRPPIPPKNHVILIGLGRVGQRVAQFLQAVYQPLVAITLNQDFDVNLLPEIPILAGKLTETMTKANLKTAKSVVVVTDDEMINLEIALSAHTVNPNTHLAIRTNGQRLSDHLTHILPQAEVLCTNAVTAEAFAGAAFGENILSLFRLDNQTVLVTEYQIDDIDTLHGRLLGEVAYGYSVLPILYQRPPHSSQFMPLDDVTLEPGDRLVVLATIAGLKKVEVGDLLPKTWQVQIEKVRNEESIFEGANLIARIAGLSLGEARHLMKQLPIALPSPLYEFQAKRLVRELNKVQVKAHCSADASPL